MQTGLTPPNFGMSSASHELRPDAPTDQPMGQEPQLDTDDILQCVMDDFSNDCKDKTEYGWVSKREYDLKAYYMVKDYAMQMRPWPGASAYPVPITPTLLDTGKANLMASKQSDDGRWVTVNGVGEEDIRKAVPLESLLNWQLNNQMAFEEVEDMTAFRMLLHGDGIQKVMQDFRKNRVKIASIDVENIYLPIDAEGMQFEHNHGHVTQIIPLTKNDIEMRKNWGIYENLDKMTPGARIAMGSQSGEDRLRKLMDAITGQDRETRDNRETYFMAETYKEYFPKSSTGYGSNGSPSRVAAKPRYLTIWWSPNGGNLHRVVEMPDKTIPFSRRRIYTNPGYFFSMSLPEKIRHIQEKANYADKQNTDSLDRAISPAMFVSDSSTLEKSRAKRVPGGIYNLGIENQPYYEPQPPRERGFEVEIQRMWQEAQQLTGLIDISYGARSGDKTLGQSEMRSFKADIRFSDLFKREQRGFKDTLDLIYHYDNQFMDRRTKVKVIGYADYKSIDELFPVEDPASMGLGLEGKFDFAFAGAAITDREALKMQEINFLGLLLTDPAVASNPHDNWNVKERLAEAHGIRDIENILSKPSQALIMGPQEAIQRVISGQTGMQIRPGIDTESYIFELELFMRTETFLALMPQLQAEILNMLKISYMIRAGEMRAMLDDQIVQQRQQAMNQMMMEQENGTGQRESQPTAQ